MKCLMQDSSNNLVWDESLKNSKQGQARNLKYPENGRKLQRRVAQTDKDMELKDLERVVGKDHRMMGLLRNDKLWQNFTDSKYLVTLKNFFHAFLIDVAQARKRDDKQVLTEWMR